MRQVNPLWAAYNNLHNEGGEGYNPHDQYIDTGSGEPEWSKLDDRRWRLINRLNATSTDDPSYTQMEAEIETLSEAIKIAKDKGI